MHCKIIVSPASKATWHLTYQPPAKMAHLIVELSHARESSGGTRVKGQSKRERVRFSLESEVQFYQRPDERDKFMLYFSKNEYRAMKAERARDVLVLYRRYLLASIAGSDPPSSEEALGDPDLTGLENILTLELMQKLADQHRQVTHAVLYEQARQAAAGQRDPEKIANAAYHYSKWSRERAENIALTQRSD